LVVTKRWVRILIGLVLLVPLALAFAYPRWMLSSGTLPSYHADLADDCFACHKPFRGAASQNCIACHVVAQISLRTTKGVPLAQSAAKTAFHQALIEQDCVVCHRGHQSPNFVPGDRKAFAHHLLRPDLRDRCSTCHVAPKDVLHRDLTAGCAQCHKPSAWKPVAFDHALLAKPVLEKCETCHRAPGNTQHANIKGNCALCHTPKQWEPATFDHAKHFVLDGDHNVPCATCHVGDDYRRYTCYGCHEHQPDRIRAKHLEEGIRNFENCARCHRNANEEPGHGGEHD
jgi:hypothetical protein